MEPSSPAHGLFAPLPDQRWRELCNGIRATDDISFKLLALVPVVTIAGIATSLFKAEPRFTAVVALLSLFAAAATRALWIWERRNIQTCRWLRARAAELEAQVLDAETPGHFLSVPLQPGGQGKTEAEQLVYGLTIGAWLLLPGAVFMSQLPTASTATWLGAAAYGLSAGWLGLTRPCLRPSSMS
jgi:hypothetical protein